MDIDEALVRRIARLARLKVSTDEAATLQGELAGILTWVEQLGAADTSTVEAMSRATGVPLRLRSDIVTDGGDAHAVLANAPAAQDGFFLVPKVVE